MTLSASIYKHSKSADNIPSAKIKNVDCHYLMNRCGNDDGRGYSPEKAKELAKTIKNENDFIIVEDICAGGRRLRAIPVSLLNSGKWTMFGGNFVWSGDSRFFEYPVKIHDWTE